MPTEKEYRENVIDHIMSTLEVLDANISYAPQTPEKEALAALLNNVARLIESTKDVKNDKAFIGLVKGIDMLLHNEYFSQIDNTEKKQPKAKEEKKPLSLQDLAEMKGIVISDPSELPEEVRVIIGETLKEMGLDAPTVNHFLNLN